MARSSSPPSSAPSSTSSSSSISPGTSGTSSGHPAPWLIEHASLDDLETIVDFNQQMARDTEGKQLEREVLTRGVQRLLENPALGCYYVVRERSHPASEDAAAEDAAAEDVATADEVVGQVAGQLMLTEEWSDWRCGRFFWIQSVYVRPAFRRQGIYRALHEHVLMEAKQDPEVCGVRLYVEVDNEGAQQTYRDLGMQECDYRMFEQSVEQRRNPRS